MEMTLRDTARGRALAAMGYRVIRVTWEEVMFGWPGARGQILEMVRRGDHPGRADGNGDREAGTLSGVNELPPSSKYVARGGEPVSDADRSDLNTRLNDAFAEGRIDEPTFQSHLDLVYRARSLGELVPVVRDLPARPAYRTPDIGPEAGVAPGELAPHRSMAPRTTFGLAIGGGAIVLVLLILAVILVF